MKSIFDKIVDLLWNWSGDKVGQVGVVEDKVKVHVYHGTPFSIRMTPVDNGKGYWGYVNVAVLRDGVHIGGYTRNYSSYAADTFHPFKVGTDWYALYSCKYTATRVARLEGSFEDWCGEESNASGFCPVEYFVPMRYKHTYKATYGGKEEERSFHMNLDGEYDTVEEFIKEYEEASASNGPIEFTTWGLMCGCVWGDDTSWKVRLVDLTKIPEKILSITERFGYHELPGNMTLRESVLLSGDRNIRLSGMEHFDVWGSETDKEGDE